MKIVPIFAKENKREGLFSVHLEGEKEDELTMLVEQWLLNPYYLFDFFTLHQNDLKDGYYGKDISIQQAIVFTQNEAEYLFNQLEQLAVSGKTVNDDNLSIVFKPLHNHEYSLKNLQAVKAKTPIKKRWLRIYAIKIGSNTFVVTGGAIKLVGTMDERKHLLKEKLKLDDIKNYLIKEGILDQDDFEMYEI